MGSILNYWSRLSWLFQDFNPQHIRIGRKKSQQGGVTVVRCRVLEEKAAEYGIADLRRFYASAAFQAARFTHDAERGVIVHSAA